MALVTLKRPEHPDPSLYPDTGPVLCLSGGGFRAMLFHLGTLRRLNELGLLPDLHRISSVSGGSIASAVLATRWGSLRFDPATGVAAGFDRVERDILDFATRRLDVAAVAGGVALPRVQVADRVRAAYGDLFGDLTLQDLPDVPRFVFCATNVGTGSLVRFAKPYLADSMVGKRDRPRTPVAVAVTASSAFPPVLSPYRLRLGDDEALTEVFTDDGRPDTPRFHDAPYTHDLWLTDGGIYDNLGLQPVEDHDTILVSDGGGPHRVQPRARRNWLLHMARSWANTDHQVRSRRRVTLMRSFDDGTRAGGFWAIDTDIRRWGTPDRLHVDPTWIDRLAGVRTRLWPVYTKGIGLRTKAEDHLRFRLVNWGYALCDATVRAKSTGSPPLPTWPFPDHALDGPADG